MELTKTINAKGYKQTEVGLIPEDWEVKTLETISNKISSGKSSTFSDSNGEVPIYGSTGLIGLSKKHDYVGKRILVARVGANAGTVYTVDKKYNVSDNTLMIKLNDEVDFNLICFYLKNFNLNKLVFGSGQPLITGGQLKNIQIPLPPLSEQKAIATALSDVDALLLSLDKQITKKKAIKQGAMQELLTPKEGWEKVKLGDIFKITAGGDLSNYETSGVEDETYIYSVYSNSLSNKGLYCFSNEFTCLENTITVTARGSVGYAEPRYNKYLAIGRLLSLESITKINIGFVAEYINNKIKFANESTGVPQLTAPQIGKYEIMLPTHLVQSRIAQILSDMDLEITSLEAKRQKYVAIKQGMMQELLTGRTRLV